MWPTFHSSGSFPNLYDNSNMVLVVHITVHTIYELMNGSPLMQLMLHVAVFSTMASIRGLRIGRNRKDEHDANQHTQEPGMYVRCSGMVD